MISASGALSQTNISFSFCSVIEFLWATQKSFGLTTWLKKLIFINTFSTWYENQGTKINLLPFDDSHMLFSKKYNFRRFQAWSVDIFQWKIQKIFILSSQKKYFLFLIMVFFPPDFMETRFRVKKIISNWFKKGDGEKGREGRKGRGKEVEI